MLALLCIGADTCEQREKVVEGFLTHLLNNSCTQKEVWECGAVGKVDKGDQDQ